ncbi:hypothetical protein B0H11DRAFT_2135724 [Mycena galericulata]|nr:hypothetical protein B0H11DRAFT_2135724 [Mycena galericulata]
MWIPYLSRPLLPIGMVSTWWAAQLGPISRRSGKGRVSRFHHSRSTFERCENSQLFTEVAGTKGVAHTINQGLPAEGKKLHADCAELQSLVPSCVQCNRLQEKMPDIQKCAMIDVGFKSLGYKFIGDILGKN